MGDDTLQGLAWVAGFRWQVARARKAAGLSEADFTRRVRAYGLDFGQEDVAKIESGIRAITLDEALVIGEVLDLELPTSPGPIRAELANTSFHSEVEKVRRNWFHILERLPSIQQGIIDLHVNISRIQSSYIAEMRAAGSVSEEKLLQSAKDLTNKISKAKTDLEDLQKELNDPHWPEPTDIDWPVAP